MDRSVVLGLFKSWIFGPSGIDHYRVGFSLAYRTAFLLQVFLHDRDTLARLKESVIYLGVSPSLSIGKLLSRKTPQ